ncbi:Protein IN CHLOROPLAST ATPASE BIOGENESIS, chloroplastic [Linum perenne]
MRIGGMVYGAPPATSLLLGHVCRRKPTLRCFSASPSRSPSLLFSDHTDFIKDVAATQPPKYLPQLLSILRSRGTLLVPQVDQFVHRILVEEDANGLSKGNNDIFTAAAVGLFPDILERKVMRHFEREDQVSAMVTGEFYTRKEHFPGFGRPFAFNAKILLKVGRKVEAKDAEVAEMAEWDDEQIEYMEERVTEDGRKQDLNKGKNPAQIAVDEAAFLMDLASVDGTWDDYLERIVGCYKEAGLHDIARFLEYRD